MTISLPCNAAVRRCLTVWLSTVFIYLGLSGLGLRAQEASVPLRSVRIPMIFEPNLGQSQAREARFVGHSGAGQVLLTQDGAILIDADKAAPPVPLRFWKG